MCSRSFLSFTHFTSSNRKENNYHSISCFYFGYIRIYTNKDFLLFYNFHISFNTNTTTNRFTLLTTQPSNRGAYSSTRNRIGDGARRSTPPRIRAGEGALGSSTSTPLCRRSDSISASKAWNDCICTWNRSAIKVNPERKSGTYLDVVHLTTVAALYSVTDDHGDRHER